MFKKALVFAVTAACLSAGAAQAQSYDNRYDQRVQQVQHGYNSYDDRASRHDNRYDNRHDGRYDGRRDGYRDSRYESRRDGRYDSRDYRYRNNHGYQVSQRHHFRRGDRLTRDHGRYYVVNDWRRHRGMYAPQRGYQWVEMNGDFALVAIATGLIAHVLLN